MTITRINVTNGETEQINEDAPSYPAPMDEQRAVAVLTRFEFARRAASAGFVTFAEAAAWAAGNAIPAKVQTIIDGLPAEEQGPVTLDVVARPEIRRSGNLMPALAAAFETDDSGLDALFGLQGQ